MRASQSVVIVHCVRKFVHARGKCLIKALATLGLGFVGVPPHAAWSVILHQLGCGVDRKSIIPDADVSGQSQAKGIDLGRVATLAADVCQISIAVVVEIPIGGVAGLEERCGVEVGLHEAVHDTDYREVIGSMLEEAGRLTRLIDALLTLARADSCSQRLERRPVDLTALARTIADDLSVLAEEKEQSLLVHKSAPVTAEVDPEILRHALLNIIDNAIKYSPPGGEIQIIVEHAPDGQAAISVTDSGPGISADHRPHIFERFYRVDKGRSSGGIGLSIAREAVLIHNGKLELESGEGRGCTFRMTVPLAPDPSTT